MTWLTTCYAYSVPWWTNYAATKTMLIITASLIGGLMLVRRITR